MNQIPPIAFAILADDLPLAKERLSLGGDINLCTPNKGTALHVAVAKNDIAAAQWLLENGAKPTIKFKGFGTPIEAAQTKEMLLLLRSHGITEYSRLEYEQEASDLFENIYILAKKPDLPALSSIHSIINHYTHVVIPHVCIHQLRDLEWTLLNARSEWSQDSSDMTFALHKVPPRLIKSLASLDPGGLDSLCKKLSHQKSWAKLRPLERPQRDLCLAQLATICKISVQKNSPLYFRSKETK